MCGKYFRKGAAEATGAEKMIKKRTATILDIARQAGVSPSTVSRVLNGNTPVAAEKQAAVQAAIGQLHYRPNTAAQGLVRGRTMAIGAITQDVASPFYGSVLLGIEHGLRGTGYHPVFADARSNPKQELETFNLILDRRVDGLILIGGILPDETIVKAAEDLPIVAVARSIKGMEKNCLRVDNIKGAYLATSHLIEFGHTRIAHITGLLSQGDARDRRDGYYRALTEAGLEIDPRLVVEGDFQEHSGLLGVEALLTRGVAFSAIFVANDQMAAGARLALYRRGIRVPDDVSLVGFDNQPGSAYATPPLTTVEQPTYEMGRQAAQGVLTMLNGQEPIFPTFSVNLLARESTKAIGQRLHTRKTG